ncbi:unnamed protein product [Dibothriocephalus latus]|uniref:NADP-dependent oxidoreductase domain-containing protein n=1 Tax=Dibothriocephalus latus TaxID=60516 RepID=A0A3P7L4Q9_DIBLA|nr:unnamed protein product [Dibothriocephalus latus]
MASQPTYLTLNSGYRMPQVGFGTFMLQGTPGEGENPVLCAIDAGYRLIDCAHLYGNEGEVGIAVRKRIDDGTISREDIFISSKLWCDAHRRSDVRPACEDSLRRFGLTYLDLYLIHFPVPLKLLNSCFTFIPLLTFFESIPEQGMEELVEAGLVRSIGVSNFNRDQLDRILAVCKIPPAVNQIEVSVNWPNEKMVNYTHSKDAPPLLEEEFVKKIALAHGKTPAQVLLRYALQRGLVVLNKSVNADRIRTNFQVQIFDFSLTEEEMDTLKANSPNCRLFTMTA